jgi:hypothetical protein
MMYLKQSALVQAKQDLVRFIQATVAAPPTAPTAQ